MRNRSLEKKLLSVLLLSIPALAANFWESKDYSKWSEQECMQLLKKSPWAYSIGFGNVGPAVIQPMSLDQEEDAAKKMARPQAGPGQITGITYGERESTQFFEFRVLTAKPVKAAIVQMQVLRNPALKEQARQIINSKPTDQIIIQFEYRTEPPGSGAVHDIHSYFLHATLADFRTNTYLASDKVDLLPVKDYLSPNEKRPKPAFVFSRFNEKGEPYFTGQENSITMRSVFEPEIGGKKQKYDVFIKMNPKEMWFQKEFAF